MLERPRGDGPAVLAAPADARETYDRADIGAVLCERRYFLRDIEIGFLNADGHIGGHGIIAIMTRGSNRRSSAGKKRTPGGRPTYRPRFRGPGPAPARNRAASRRGRHNSLPPAPPPQHT